MLYACGSILGHWNTLNTITDDIIVDASKKKPVHLVVCGDFGYNPNNPGFSMSDINTYDGRLRIYFLRGECDDNDAIKELENSDKFDFITPVYKNIYYCTFGAIATLDRKKCLFCGGASSYDRSHDDPMEPSAIRLEDMRMLPKDYHPGIVFSHTIPSSVTYALKNKEIIPYNDQSTKLLTEVLRMYNPKRWVFGHLGSYLCFRDHRTDFVSLDCLGNNDTNISNFLYKIY